MNKINNNISGLVVTFNPTLQQIKNLSITAKLVDILYVYDNSCNYQIQKKIKRFLAESNIKIYFNKKNYGIGKSANMFFNNIKKKYEWCFLMDQDSKFDIDLKTVTKFLKNKNILIAGFNFKEKISFQNQYDLIELKPVRRIIFSGSIINKKIFNKFFFKEELFLDMTDFSFCKILNSHNIKIWKIMNIYFEHHVGSTKINSFLFLRKKRSNHPPINCFLMARNRILLARKKLYDETLSYILIRQLKEIIYTFLFEKDAKRKIYARLKGIWHGLRNTQYDSLDDIKKIL